MPGIPWHRLLLGLPLVLCATQVALAQSPADPESAQQIREEVDRLKKEFDELRDQYGTRLAELERRLAALDGRTAVAPPPAVAPEPPQAAPPVVDVPAGAAGAGGPSGPLPVYGAATSGSKVFNPDMAVIGNFIGDAGTNTNEPSPSLSLSEAEVSFQAIVDPYARADFFLGFSQEGVDIEEGFITFLTLPGGLLAKVGKTYYAFGKANTLHSHALPWTDRPLVLRNLVGGDENLSDSGISVSKLIFNPLLFLEATGEIYRGDSSVFSAPTPSDLSYAARLRGYRDLTEATNVDVGTSFAYGHNDAGPDETTRLVGVDATFRWRPLRRAIYRRLLARSEFVWSRREQPEGAADAFGVYVGADYQFARRWFAGARYDYSERADDASLHDEGPSLLLTFWPSEFSQIRGQYRRTRYAEGATGNEFLFQFLFSIGAHGAHAF